MVPCDSIGSRRVLCRVNTAENQTRGKKIANKRQYRYRRASVGRSVSSSSAAHSSFVSCPKKHVTHSFLACDLPSACWLTSNGIFVSTEEGKDIPLASSCPINMTSLPPSFLCTSGVQRVPYTLVCDHRADCQDNSDEDFCHYAACSRSTFTCGVSKQVR